MTSHRRRAMTAVAAVAAIACIAIALLHRDARDTTSHASTTHRSTSSIRSTPAGAAEVAEYAKRRSLFGQRDVALRRIAGRVTLAGKPFANARVALRWAGIEAGIAPPAPVATDAEGRFDLGAWFAERFTVTATADGLTPAVVETDLRDPTAVPAPDQLELALTPCTHTLVGSVSDGSGGPVAGAAVARVHSVGVATAADGRYALCLAPGKQTVAVTADGYGGVVLAVDIRGQVRRDIALVPAGAIHGSVVDSRDHKPVADALISAWPVTAGPNHPLEVLGHSDSEGRFQLAGFAPGRFTVWASTGQLLGSAVVAVVPTRSVEVTIAVSDQARVAGRVVANGKPVAGARVFARSTARAVGSRTSISQLDGSFVLDEVPLGTVVFSAPPYEVVAPPRLIVDRPDVTGVVVELAPMASISGRVLQDGQPIAGARVVITPDDNAVTSDSQGQYRLQGFRPGTYAVHAEADAGASPPQSVVVAAGQAVGNLDLELTSRAHIAGAVVDQEGRAVRDAIVAWTDSASGDSRRATTNDLGQFFVDRLRGDGSYAPSVRAYERDAALGFIGESPTVVLDAQRRQADGVQLQVRLERRTISGRVIDTTGAAVADARVDVITAPRSGTAVFHGWQPTPSTVSTADGAFSLTGLAEGAYAVRARSADDREVIASPVDAGASDVTLQLRASATIAVTLVGFASTPAVDAQNARGDFQKFYGTVDGARATITGLPPGRYIVAAHTAQELDAVAVVLADGATAPVTLTSHGSAHLTATIRNFVTGVPVPDMKCLVFPTVDGMLGPDPVWDLSAAPASDAQGQVAIDPAPAGPIAVYCYNPAAGMSSARAFVTLEPGARGTAQLLGVHLEPPALGDLGVDLDQGFPLVVTSVRDDGPAAAAGIRAGDQLVALDGHPIDQLSKGGVLFWIQSHRVGARITVTVKRGSENHAVGVVVGHTLAQPSP